MGHRFVPPLHFIVVTALFLSELILFIYLLIYILPVTTLPQSRLCDLSCLYHVPSACNVEGVQLTFIEWIREWANGWNNLVGPQGFGVVWGNLQSFHKEQKPEHQWRHEWLTKEVKCVHSCNWVIIWHPMWFVTAVAGSRQGKARHQYVHSRSDP